MTKLKIKNSSKPKSTRSSPNPATMNLLRALRKTRSMNNESQNSQSKSREEASIKNKPISEKLQKQLNKKKKRAKPDTIPNQTQGLKLLKRGCVTMHRIIRRKMMNVKLKVPFNTKGEPLGDQGAEMQSYIGVSARTKPIIWHDNWKDVPVDTKNKIWVCVQVNSNLIFVHLKITWILNVFV